MMTEVRWNLEEIKSEEGFHDLVQDSLSFPHYYGRNQDAFWDCLNEIVEETTVHVTGRSSLPDNLMHAIDSYLEMCKEYAEAEEHPFHLIVED